MATATPRLRSPKATTRLCASISRRKHAGASSAGARLRLAARRERPARRPKDIGEHLTKAVRAVVKQNPTLSGVIDVVDFAAERNGERDINPAKLRGVVETFSDPRYRLGLADVQPDFLGRAYEYLLRKFAEGSGQSAGEFFTPTEVGFLMAHIMRPRPGEDCHDYACGSAGLLMKLQLVARELDPTEQGAAEALRPGASGRELRRRAR